MFQKELEWERAGNVDAYSLQPEVDAARALPNTWKNTMAGKPLRRAFCIRKFGFRGVASLPVAPTKAMDVGSVSSLC